MMARLAAITRAAVGAGCVWPASHRPRDHLRNEPAPNGTVL